MFKNFSLKTKIFFLTTTIVVASFLAVTWIVSDRTIEMAKRDAFILADETANRYVNEIRAELQGARITSETLATVFETLKDHDLTDRDMMNDILKNALADKEYITAFCIAYDPNALDGKDAEYAGRQPLYDETGRYAPYWNKLGDKIDVEPLHDVDTADWYIVPKTTKKEYITDPYPYHVQGRSVMLASLIFPIIHKDRFIGIASSDIVLDTLQEMVTRVNPGGWGGYTEIFANSGAIVAHPDKRFLGKHLSEALAYELLTADPSSAEPAIRYVEQCLEESRAAADPEAGAEKSGVLETLLDDLKTYATDPGGAEPDLALFTPEVAVGFLEAVASRSQYGGKAGEARETGEAIRNGERHVNADADFYTIYVPIRFSDATMPWSVAVSIPMADILVNANAIRNYVVGVSIVAICLIAFVIYLVAKSVTRPVLALTRVAKAIGEGHFDADMPAFRSGDEIGILAGAFKIMAGKINELIGKMQDYARELEEKNKYLNRLNELKDEFLANTSHELRTPINGIIGIAESMVDGAVGPLTQEQRYNLRIVANSGKRLSSMINDILDFTKLKNAELTLAIKPVDLKTIVDTVLVLSNPLIKGKDLRLVNAVDDALPAISADENRLQQILYNLIGNAIKFTDQGQIVVSAVITHRHPGDAPSGTTRIRKVGISARVNRLVEISVSDTGIGIPEEALDRIFESFEQVDGSTAREYGGTGLGLSITKKLVELQGGTVTVRSTVGEGSIFTFTVPVSNAETEGAGDERPGSPAVAEAEDAAAPDAEERYEQAIINPGGSHKILVIDDEAVNIQVLKNYLVTRNYCVYTAYSGPEALKLIESEENFDLILLDVMMPKMSGYDVCRRLRERHSLFDLPILMLTAKNQVHDIVMGFQSGANDYLQKPFDKMELLARVNTLLSLKMAVAAAIENEKHFENERQKRLFGQTLLDVTKAIVSTLDLREVLMKILEAMSHFIAFGSSAVALREEDGFVVKVSSGFGDENAQEGAVIDMAGDEFFKKIVRVRKIVSTSGLKTCFLNGIADGQTLIGIPIVYRDNLLGAIVITCAPGIGSSDLLSTLAGQAGVAIQNAKLFAKIAAMATMDGLTGLNNRRHFFELADMEFAKCLRYGNPL